MFVWVRKKYYECFSSDKACEKRVKRLLNLKVQSPLDKNDVITLGDIVFSTAMTEKEIFRIVRSYGIDLPSKARDITLDKSLEYLLYHGKDFQYTYINSTGEKVVAGIEQIGNGQYITNIPLIPDTHLDRIISLYYGSQEGISSFYGHVSEFAVRDTLIKNGYQVFVPSASNTPGYDLCVEKSFFDDYGLNYIENPDMPGYGVLQVKSTIGDNVANYTSNTLRHFDKYSNIPVVASNRIVEDIEGFEDKLISFNDIGINEEALQRSIIHHFNLETGELLPETLVFNRGLDCVHFENALDNSVDALNWEDFTSGMWSEHVHLPWIGMAIAASISTYKQYRMVQNNQINWTRASINIAQDTGKAAIISTTTIGLTSLTAGAFGISATKSANGIAEWAFGDVDLDLSDVGELGIYIAIAAGIGYSVKKLWNWIVGDPLEHLKNLNMRRVRILDAICVDIGIRRENLIDILTPPEDIELKNNLMYEMGILRSRNDELIERYRNKIKSLSYYVIKEKMNLLETVLNKMTEEYLTKRKEVEEYIDRILTVSYLAKNCDADNVSSTKRRFCKLYRKNLSIVDESNIRRKINNKEQLLSLLYNVLNDECKKLLEIIGGIENEFRRYKERLDDCNVAIQNEVSRLQAQGKL